MSWISLLVIHAHSIASYLKVIDHCWCSHTVCVCVGAVFMCHSSLFGSGGGDKRPWPSVIIIIIKKSAKEMSGGWFLWGRINLGVSPLGGISMWNRTTEEVRALGSETCQLGLLAGVINIFTTLAWHPGCQSCQAPHTHTRSWDGLKNCYQQANIFMLTIFRSLMASWCSSY